MTETTMVAIDGTDALAFVIIRPGSQPDTVAIEASARGISEPDAAYVLRTTAQQWDPQHVAEFGPHAPDGFPLLRVLFDFHPAAPAAARHAYAALVTETVGDVLARAARPDDADADGPTITPEAAAHVLWSADRGGYPPASFTELLLRAWNRADDGNHRALSAAYPAYGAALNLLREPGGVQRLQTIAAA